MQAWCDNRGFDTVIHPIPKCVIFLEDLLQETVNKKSRTHFGTIRVARKARSGIASSPVKHGSGHCKSSGMVLSTCRELQRGVPPPYGEHFSKETLIKSALSKAFAATTEARIDNTQIMPGCPHNATQDFCWELHCRFQQ